MSRSGQPLESNRRYLNPSDAANRYGCSPKTIRRYIASGQIRAYRFGPRMLRIDEAELDAFMRRLPTVGGAA